MTADTPTDESAIWNLPESANTGRDIPSIGAGRDAERRCWLELYGRLKQLGHRGRSYCLCSLYGIRRKPAGMIFYSDAIPNGPCLYQSIRRQLVDSDQFELVIHGPSWFSGTG